MTAEDRDRIDKHVRVEAWIATNPLRLWRNRQRLSQGAVAVLVGVSSVTIGNWERSYSSFSSVSERALAGAMGVTVEALREAWASWLNERPWKDNVKQWFGGKSA